MIDMTRPQTKVKILSKTFVGLVVAGNGKEYDLYETPVSFGFYSKNCQTPGRFIEGRTLEEIVDYIYMNN